MFREVEGSYQLLNKSPNIKTYEGCLQFRSGIGRVPTLCGKAAPVLLELRKWKDIPLYLMKGCSDFNRGRRTVLSVPGGT